MIEIRSGRPADHERLREIQQATLAEPWPEILETATAGGVPLFVAVDTVPIGYTIVVPGPEDVVYLPEIAIAPDRQREGHGSALLGAVCDELASDGYDELRLTAEASDERAREFYRQNGFEPIERLPDEYESGDGVLFARDL